MGRISGYRPREATTKKKEINPLWRGVGCLMFLFLTVGCYLFAELYLVDAVDRFVRASPSMPAELRQNGIRSQTIRPLIDYAIPEPKPLPLIGITLPRFIDRITLTFDPVVLAFTLVLSLIAFAISGLVWALVNPPKLGPKDAPPVRRKIDKSKVR